MNAWTDSHLAQHTSWVRGNAETKVRAALRSICDHILSNAEAPRWLRNRSILHTLTRGIFLGPTPVNQNKTIHTYRSTHSTVSHKNRFSAHPGMHPTVPISLLLLKSPPCLGNPCLLPPTHLSVLVLGVIRHVARGEVSPVIAHNIIGIVPEDVWTDGQVRVANRHANPLLGAY